MILQEGSRVLVVHRRLFERDESRFFVGIVDGYEHGIAKVTGYSWVRDQLGGKWLKKPDRRTKVLAMSSGSLIVYELPSDLEPQGVRIVEDREGRTRISDGGSFHMDLTERPH